MSEDICPTCGYQKGACMCMGIQIVVTEGGASGNNPARIRDSQGFSTLLWSHWTRGLGLEKGMKGTLYFVEDIN